MTDYQQQVIDGSMLGDGCIKETKTSANFTKSQSSTDKEGKPKLDYVIWHAGVLEPHTRSIRPYKSYRFKKWHFGHVLTTHVNPTWMDLAHRWYLHKDGAPVLRKNKRIKVVPNDIRLTPVSLCIWFMDDGSNELDARRIKIATDGFTTEEVSFLTERLRTDLQIDSLWRLNKKGHPQIFIKSESYQGFIETIKPHVCWNAMAYKLNYRDRQYTPRGESHWGSKLTEQDAKDIISLRKDGWLVADLSNRFGVSETSISLITRGLEWSHLGGNMDHIKKPRISKQTKSTVRDMQRRGYTQKDIATKIGINQASVSRILKNS